MEPKYIKILVLAAGKGTRMKSELPKVLTLLHGKPMISYLLDEIVASGIDARPSIVVGYKKELVMETLGDAFHYIVQTDQLGTGHAVLSAADHLKDAAHVMVLLGDNPCMKAATLRKLVEQHIASGAMMTGTTTILPDFLDWRQLFLKYGRIIRHGDDITDREFKDATEEEKKITEVNTSSYIFNGPWLWENLQKIKSDNAQQEYYLTDLWHIASTNGDTIDTLRIDPTEALAANSKEELEILEKFVV